MFVSRDNPMSMNRMDSSHYGLFSLTAAQSWAYPSLNLHDHSTWHSHVYNTPPKQPTPHCIADILRRSCRPVHRKTTNDTDYGGVEATDSPGETHATDLRVVKPSRAVIHQVHNTQRRYSVSECSDSSSQHSSCAGETYIFVVDLYIYLTLYCCQG